MQQHDIYGKLLLRNLSGYNFCENGIETHINYGSGGPARIDGTISGKVAVEIESRVSKQIRGAILDLICHPFPKKLLILLPVHMHNPEIALEQSVFILSKFIKKEDFQVILLKGTGNLGMYEKIDTITITECLNKLLD